MGSALVKGLLSDSFPPYNIWISNPHLNKLDELASLGVNVTKSNIEAAEGADLIVIAVKPWKLEEVAKEIAPYIKSSREISCIVAGIDGESIIRMFQSSPHTSLSISMPNTAMKVSQSMTFIVELKGNATLAKEVFEKVGKVDIIEERLLPGATALASCGIAYAMRYVRAATEGGVELGFRASEAQDIVTQTLLGACALLQQPGAHPETDIDKVTTPGGITIRGLNAMEKAGFTNSVIEGLKASSNK